MVEGDTVQAYRNFYKGCKKEFRNMEKQTDTNLVQDPGLERYYDWILWKLRQEKYT